MSKETDRAIQRAQQIEATGTASEDSDSDVLRSTGTMAMASCISGSKSAPLLSIAFTPFSSRYFTSLL